MLSIIICTLNEEHYLPMLLDTLNQQKGTVFEVIIVDAHSDDDTIGVVKSYQTRTNYPIRFFQLERPGISMQRNIGVDHALNEQLLFLDADVVLPQDFIKESLRQITSEKIEIAGTKIYSAEANPLFRLMYWSYSTFYLPIVRLTNPILHGCSIFATKVIHQKVGGFNKDVTFEDFRYAADAAKFYRPKLLKKVYVKTSARRYYKFNFAEWSELFLAGIYSIFRAGIEGNKSMKRYHENSGKHPLPKY
jgi:glycosyltransferase involved in cell wall biosynthesis